MADVTFGEQQGRVAAIFAWSNSSHHQTFSRTFYVFCFVCACFVYSASHILFFADFRACYVCRVRWARGLALFDFLHFRSACGLALCAFFVCMLVQSYCYRSADARVALLLLRGSRGGVVFMDQTGFRTKFKPRANTATESHVVNCSDRNKVVQLLPAPPKPWEG